MRIAFLLANDIFTGYNKRPKRDTPIIEEEKDNVDSFNQEGERVSTGVFEMVPELHSGSSTSEETEQQEAESSDRLAETQGGVSLVAD
jgi:hypothetical protein